VLGPWCRFEILEILRKLILIGVLTAVSPNSIAYFNVALAVSFGAFGIFCHSHPLADPSADRLQSCALLVTVLTVFYGVVSASTKYGLPDTAAHANERTVQVRAGAPLWCAHRWRWDLPTASCAFRRGRCLRPSTLASC
jgi:hypothetical protein